MNSEMDEKPEDTRLDSLFDAPEDDLFQPPPLSPGLQPSQNDQPEKVIQPAVSMTSAVTMRSPAGQMTAKRQIATPKRQVRLDDPTDARALRRRTYDRVLQAAQNIQPISNNRHTLRVRDVAYDGPETRSTEQQKQAILAGRSLDRRLVGTWELVDNETQEVLDARRQTIAQVPMFTDQGVLIDRGTMYSVSNQTRLKPGVYSRIRSNGEISAQVNVAPGSGRTHHYDLDPASGVFYVNVGQSRIPILPLLQSLGATESQMIEAWGNDIYKANATKRATGALNKLFDRFVGRIPGNASPSDEDKQVALREAMEKTQLDPDVTTSTLGQPFANVTPEMILAATSKLVAINRKKAEPDDRDSLAYKRFLTPDDLFAERIEKDAGGLRRNLLWRASQSKSLKPIAPGALSPQLRAVIHGSGLGQAVEQINPIELLDKMTKVTSMGEGGIRSTDAIPLESRSVQPTHLGFIDPSRTSESLKVGIDLHLASGVRKGDDGRIYAPFLDAKTGEKVYKATDDIGGLTISFPNEMRRKTKRIGAIQKGKLQYVPREQVDLVVGDFEKAFSPIANLVPLKSGIKAQRLAMGSRMVTQALPLQKGEAPFVQTLSEGDRSYEEELGAKAGAFRASQGGRVMKVTPNEMHVRYADGTTEKIDLYNYHASNRKTYTHSTPLVGVGETFRPGQTLVRSNYTDDRGALATGVNLRTAYVTKGGMVFEDAVVISDRAAREKLVSQHMYSSGMDRDKNTVTKLADYIAAYPGKYTKKDYEKYDEDGVIKPGQTVRKDDPLILALRKTTTKHGRIHKKGKTQYEDASDLWNHSNEGIVTDVYKDDKRIRVFVRSYAPAQIGDKLSGLRGDKGVISRIVPEDEMPKGADGRPMELLLNPHGLISRVNSAQIIDTVLGKIAEKTGKPYKIKDFDQIEDLVEFAQGELKKHGLTDLEEILDPQTGKKIKDVLVGSRYFMKLHHDAESKGSSRGLEGGYTQTGEPGKSDPEERSKRLAALEVNALQAHGVPAVLRDASVIRGQRNDEYWVPYLNGQMPPTPKVPMMYERFVNNMMASGINVVKTGTTTQIMGLKAADIDRLAGNREVKNSETVTFNEALDPIPGGLFDPKTFGDGRRWGRINLHQPLPNPVFEEPIRIMLGLTQKQYEDTLAGKHKLHGMTGPQAIQTLLSKINIDKEIEYARQQIASGKKTYRDKAIRKLRYLTAAKETGVKPSDWMLPAVPVLPPAFRPISMMQGKNTPLVADANMLYKELIEANDNWKSLSEVVDETGQEAFTTYQSFKALTGLTDPVQPELREKGVKGLLKDVFGSSPKTSITQKNLLGSQVNLVGRGVIAPDPKLDMDSIAIPEDQAWKVYSPIVRRKLRQRGMKLVDAARMVESRDKQAKEELFNAMRETPVIMSRAPVLHKFGIQAYWPTLTKDKVIKLSPLIVAGHGADFDGDAVNFHVPIDEDARRQTIERMLPSKNLISPADFESPVHNLSNEYAGGIYSLTASRGPRKNKRVFQNMAALKAAFARGDVDAGDMVELLE